MPRNEIGDLPYPPLEIVDTATPVTADQITDLFQKHPDGTSFCVRSADGHPIRGGYFFHAVPYPDGVEIFDIEKHLIAKIAPDQFVLFVNHCTGLAFSEWAFQFCQSVVNFRTDPAESS